MFSYVTAADAAAEHERFLEIQERISQLRAVRDALAEDAYLAAMEELLVELALKNREIRALEGGNK